LLQAVENCIQIAVSGVTFALISARLTNKAMGGGMPIYDYALLALLASGGHGLEGSTLTLGPDAIVQSQGGGLVLLVKDFIKFDGVEGEAKDKDHKSWSDQSRPIKPPLQNIQPQLHNTPQTKLK